MGSVPEEDVRRTFNMGLGYILVVPKGSSKEAISLLKTAGYKAYLIGNTVKGLKGVSYL